jgi:hypothetical protein
MIQAEKLQPALRALNMILTRARWMAHEGRSAEVAELLDAAEILPSYLAQAEDATSDVHATLESISKQFPECSSVLREFERDCACVDSSV